MTNQPLDKKTFYLVGEGTAIYTEDVKLAMQKLQSRLKEEMRLDEFNTKYAGIEQQLNNIIDKAFQEEIGESLIGKPVDLSRRSL